MGQEYLSDSTQSRSSVSVDLLSKRPALDISLPKSVPHTTRRFTKHHQKPTYKVGRRQSLVQCLERQSLFKKKERTCNNSLPVYNKNNVITNPVFFKDQHCMPSEWRGSGDNARNNLSDTQYTYIALPQQTKMAVADKKNFAEPEGFPFKSTPSGNFKLKPSQVVYESKNLSIVAADPQNICLNVTESSQGEQMETSSPSEGKKLENENWDTMCIFTATGVGNPSFGSEFSDTVSESDGGIIFEKERSADKQSELNLAKMGYVIDNCIDWKCFDLPRKSELQKLLLETVLNITNPDIKIKIGSKTINCHRIVLQCYSTYFTSKFGHEVELPESVICKETFALIYQWMLHLDTDSYQLLRRDNILDIYEAAQFLGIPELEAQCVSFIQNVDIFCEDKAFLLYIDARKHKNQEVMSLMVPRVQRFFLTLVSSKEFVEFTVEEVCNFLSSNYICVHSEVEVFMAGVRWLMYDWPKRKSLTVEVMKCVRFGLIDPKVLVTLRRSPQSPEFVQISNIPEVSSMIDDGLALTVLKSSLACESEEEFNKILHSMGLANPICRNWAGTAKNYRTYQEFQRDLSHYRSKQRLEIKRSRMKVQLDKVNDEEFLSSAVLPPATQQKIQSMHGMQTSLIDAIPQLDSKELSLLRKIICNDNQAGQKNQPVKTNPCSSSNRDSKKKNPYKSSYATTDNTRIKKPRKETLSIEEQDLAARKIQHAYRNFSEKNIRTSSIEEQDLAARKIQHAYRNFSEKKPKTHPRTKTDHHDSNNKHVSTNIHFRSMSDPSLPSSLMNSTTHPKICQDVNVPLQPGKETVFVFGGNDTYSKIGSCNSSQNIYQYHMNSNTWRKCGELPAPMQYHCAVCHQGTIYIAGGTNPTKLIKDSCEVSQKVWKFNSKYKTWSRIKDMLHPRYIFCMVSSNNKLFVIGGKDDKYRSIACVEKYDTYTENWEEVRPMNVPRAGGAAADFNNRIWVAGGLTGRQGPGSATTSVEYYDYQHNMWVQCTSLRYAQAYNVMVPASGRLYLVGGVIGLRDADLSGSSKHIDIWDSDSQSWDLASMMSKPRHSHAAVHIRGISGSECGHLFILGGLLSKHSKTTDNVECWRIEDDHWIVGIAPLPHNMCGLAALALPHDIMG